jgi:hypothetical protein
MPFNFSDSRIYKIIVIIYKPKNNFVFLSSACHPVWLWGLLSNRYGGGALSPGIWSRHEADHSLPTIAEIKNMWIYNRT